MLNIIQSNKVKVKQPIKQGDYFQSANQSEMSITNKPIKQGE